MSAKTLTQTAFFKVDPRLAALLGQTYRSSELAIKELVDKSWDADADNVWITLPAIVSGEPIVVRDDGTGMTEQEVRCIDAVLVA
ncbi:MAG: ATP-binding protein [Candidatus Sulfotelmatobacter sp.]|jgi:DNA mismatch repair ATPase MutL